ncbi:MAG: class I SAM-dependent methyltransferase [Pseudomonadota bacterium]
MEKRKYSALYRHIAKLHDGRPWGELLDAGAGTSSLRWISSLKTERWTGVTGSESHAKKIRKEIAGMQRPQDKLIVANWADTNLLKNEEFDTVIADYLLGAIEGFAPYFQSHLFPRLRPLTKGWLYITGCEPYVPQRQPKDKAAKIVWEIGRYRDACVLLAGDRPYREYPAHWVVNQLENAGFKVTNVKHFNIRVKERFINGQIDLCKPALNMLKDIDLANALLSRGETLRAEALALLKDEDGVLRTGKDYVIAAKPR